MPYLISFITIVALVGLMVAPLGAQAPTGLRVRVDESRSAEDPDDTRELKTMALGKGYRVTGGPAGTFWNPSQTATGNYTLRGTFNLMKPSGHVNFYGLIFGGAQLDGAAETYAYFLVGQNGTFLVRQRAGEQVTDIQPRKAHDAIRRPGADGRSTNQLEVRVAGDTVSFVVNGTVVHSAPKASLKTDGIAGARVNHLLDVHVDGIEVVRP
ncbi:MAG: hypothetical protein ABL993_06175 [Vicinamibacterales bacterium]